MKITAEINLSQIINNEDQRDQVLSYIGTDNVANWLAEKAQEGWAINAFGVDVVINWLRSNGHLEASND